MASLSVADPGIWAPWRITFLTSAALADLLLDRPLLCDERPDITSFERDALEAGDDVPQRREQPGELLVGRRGVPRGALNEPARHRSDQRSTSTRVASRMPGPDQGLRTRKRSGRSIALGGPECRPVVLGDLEPGPSADKAPARLPAARRPRASPYQPRTRSAAGPEGVRPSIPATSDRTVSMSRFATPHVRLQAALETRLRPQLLGRCSHLLRRSGLCRDSGSCPGALRPTGD